MGTPFILYNSLTRKKEEFKPSDPDRVTMYTCGPTVYNYAHIGNLRTFFLYDMLRRTLESKGWTVEHVMNITDVGHLASDADEGQDKMELGAEREGKTAWEIAEHYTAAFIENTKALNLLPPTKMPKATEHIQEQIELVKQLEAQEYTYKTSDGIYFDTSKFDEYGAMARLDIQGLQEGARVEQNKEKKNPTDFALWKFSPKDKKRQMEWDSPWGVGFPGWHLECSAMAMKYLGETIDIHGGGVDHIQVHHTNEIAQSEAATGKLFARWWVHGEFLLIDEGRMGKSKGNFIILQTLTDKGYSPLAYRYFLLGAHYRSKLNFTWTSMDAAQQTMNKLVYMAAQMDEPTTADSSQLKGFFRAVYDDMNMPEALAVMWNLLKSDKPSEVKAATLFEMDAILGLDLRNQATALKEKLDAAGSELREMLEQRIRARSEKDFEQADAIRGSIHEKGFIIEDTEDGPVLRPV